MTPAAVLVGAQMDQQLRQVQAALGLTSAQCAVVLRLWRHKGWASDGALRATVAPHLPSGRPWAVQIGVDAIRAKTDSAMFILGHADHGWTLGAPGVRRVREILGAGGDEDA